MTRTRARRSQQNNGPASISTAPTAPERPTTVTPLSLTTTNRPAPAKPALPTRPPTPPWMTDAQGFATLAALLADIPTPHITNWTDHGDQTASRPHHDGTLHYSHPTRTLTWIAPCPQGANHTCPLQAPGDFRAARRHLAWCRKDHGPVRSLATAFAPGRDNDAELVDDPAKTQPMSVAQIADALTTHAGEQPKEHPQP